jgi:hypothetical protein
MKTMLVALGLLMATGGAAQETPTFRPAHWVSGDNLEPTFHAFSFNALAFPTPDEGWIVGDKYLLHVQGERLEVAFLELWDSLYTVSFSGRFLGWAGGNGPPRGHFPLLRRSDGLWQHDQIAGMIWPHWSIGKIIAGPTGYAWARAAVSDVPFDQLVAKRPRRVMLRYDGSTWTVDETFLAGFTDVDILDACQTPEGMWWFAGVDRSATSGMNAFVARWDGSALKREAQPSSEIERSGLSRIRCPADGSVWAMGDFRPTKDEARQVLLMRRMSDWQRVSVPTELPGDVVPTSLAAIDRGEVWISANCHVFEVECRERYFHLRDGIWETVELPLLPGGRSTKIWIVDTQFVSPTEAWAIAKDLEYRSGGGRIFHYRDGKWRNRNWNWHFWDAPGFGLFGY